MELRGYRRANKPQSGLFSRHYFNGRVVLRVRGRRAVPVVLDHAVAHADMGLDILGMAGVSLQLFAKRGHENPQGGQLRGHASGGASPDLT